MRRLILVLTAAAAGVAVYRQLRIARSEQELGLADVEGPAGSEAAPMGTPSSTPPAQRPPGRTLRA